MYIHTYIYETHTNTSDWGAKIRTPVTRLSCSVYGCAAATTTKKKTLRRHKGGRTRKTLYPCIRDTYTRAAHASLHMLYTCSGVVFTHTDAFRLKGRTAPACGLLKTSTWGEGTICLSSKTTGSYIFHRLCVRADGHGGPDNLKTSPIYINLYDAIKHWKQSTDLANPPQACIHT